MSNSETINPKSATPPITIAGGAAAARSHFGAERPLPPEFLGRLAALDIAVVPDAEGTAEASRDWWPLAMIWATEGQVAARAGVVARPTTAYAVQQVHKLCHEFGVPVTPIGGRSGVLGASVPIYGGVLLDTTQMFGITSVDAESGLVEVLPGTFGDHFEEILQRDHGLTVGHWPQSMTLSTVGGWVACRGAGQLSTRYGKIEDLVAGLSVVLADGSLVHTGGYPRAAMGGDLTQLFIGSEGTLGTIVSVTLRARPAPTYAANSAWAFTSFEAGLETMRRAVRRGATPAVLRLYDAIESDRSYSTGPDKHLLLVRDEGEELLVNASLAILSEEVDRAICDGLCAPADAGLVDSWMGHRNDVSALERLIEGGYVVDTMEVSAPWSRLEAIYQSATAAIAAVPGTIVASAHQSHSYLDGGCLYFTFAGKPESADRDRFYLQAWEAGTTAVIEAGGSSSHHHGIGLNRSRFMARANPSSTELAQRIRRALDPNDTCNPGKLGAANQLELG